ncbi:PEP-CTERM sorting domain-containing protein [Emcibacter nanhaiensis]|uniref:PEP-CTERM sorting domain-containing protein n=1 Tax=Emcibacter nanhaiensis TaxID=1505037 RepID=A0A501PQ57_9PROT|nr:PEP-CTERM sorting domain-containing protein [Emcibacter nanhaiensis]TPD61916.1 PEP-CTERM sorting domain-containing protein [Emcibacter nanhaiensis]
MLRSLAIAAALVTVGFAGTASAAAVDVNTFDNGWYDNNGNHNASNDNTITGRCCGEEEYRSWYAFDLSSVSGTVTSATITFYANGSYYSADSSETLQLNSFEGDIAALVAGGSGLTGIFDDLGDGDVYGSYEYAASQFSNMVEFTVSLTLDAIADINAAIGGNFAIGGMLTTLSDRTDEESIFSSSGITPAAYLTLVTGEVVETPAPAALGLLGLGLAGFGLARRRRS